MVTHLLRDFLSYEDQYRAAEQFWSELFDDLCIERGQMGEWKSWIPRTFLDGSPMPPDGNPIFDARSERLGRAVRVIQSAPTTNEVEIAGWMSSFDYTDSKGPGYTEELNISCALSEESAAIAKALIGEWMRSDIDRSQMEKVILDALDSFLV